MLPGFCNIRELKVVQQFVRAILSNFHLLESFLNITQSKIDLICISETHIKDRDYSDNSDFYSLPSHTFSIETEQFEQVETLEYIELNNELMN